MRKRGPTRSVPRRTRKRPTTVRVGRKDSMEPVAPRNRLRWPRAQRSRRCCPGWRGAEVRERDVATEHCGDARATGTAHAKERPMKSILDPAFRYTPSVETDLRKTFARIRREQRCANRSNPIRAEARKNVLPILPRPAGHFEAVAACATTGAAAPGAQAPPRLRAPKNAGRTYTPRGLRLRGSRVRRRAPRHACPTPPAGASRTRRRCRNTSRAARRCRA